MLTMASLQERRRELRARSDCTFVEKDEFCRMLVSTEKLVRCDEAAFGVRGLTAPNSLMRFLIEEEKLFAG